MKNNKILLDEIMGEIQTTNVFLGFILESVAEGAGLPSKKDLDYALNDIWKRNMAVVEALEELYKCI